MLCHSERMTGFLPKYSSASFGERHYKWNILDLTSELLWGWEGRGVTENFLCTTDFNKLVDCGLHTEPTVALPLPSGKETRTSLQQKADFLVTPLNVNGLLAPASARWIFRELWPACIGAGLKTGLNSAVTTHLLQKSWNPGCSLVQFW